MGAHRKKLSPEAQALIVAAVINGKPQVEVAKEFGVHRNTVQNLCASVRKDRELERNPLSGTFKDHLLKDATVAVHAGLRCKADPYKRMNGGIRVLEGLGVFVHAEVNDTTITVTWQSRDDDAIDVTPE